MKVQPNNGSTKNGNRNSGAHNAREQQKKTYPRKPIAILEAELVLAKARHEWELESRQSESWKVRPTPVANLHNQSAQRQAQTLRATLRGSGASESDTEVRSSDGGEAKEKERNVPFDDSEDRVGREKPIKKPGTSSSAKAMATEFARMSAESGGLRDALREMSIDNHELRQEAVDTNKPVQFARSDKSQRKLRDRMTRFHIELEEKNFSYARFKVVLTYVLGLITFAAAGVGKVTLAGGLRFIAMPVFKLFLNHKIDGYLKVIDFAVTLLGFAMSHLYLVTTCVLLWLAAVALVAKIITGKFNLMRLYHSYRVVKLVDHDHEDENAKAQSSREREYLDPVYADVEHRVVTVSLWWVSVQSSVVRVSFELFAQLTNPTIMVAGRDPKLVAIALAAAASRTESVSVSRFNVFAENADGTFGQSVHANTVRMAWAFFLVLEKRAEHQPFRLSP